MSDLIRAAQVFSFVIPEWLDDEVEVGKIAGVTVHAGEVRRLNKALAEYGEVQLRSQIASYPTTRDLVVSYLAARDLIQAIRLVRERLSLNLKEAKDYVEKIGVEVGLRRVEAWPQKLNTTYAWVDKCAKLGTD